MKKVKLFQFADDRIVYIENTKDAAKKKLLDLINTVNKVAGYKNQGTKVSCICI